MNAERLFDWKEI